MTIPLEHIQEGDWAALIQVINQLRSLVPDTGGVSLGFRVGTVTVTWPGGSTVSTATTNVLHGMGGKTPRIYLTGNVTGVGAVGWASSITSSKFDVTADSRSGTPPAGTTDTLVWMAVG